MATSAGMRVGLSIRPQTAVKVRTPEPSQSIRQPPSNGLPALLAALGGRLPPSCRNAGQLRIL
jgi:hypothetical protein